MALNINKATIGYDQNELHNALKEIQTEVIQKTCDALDTNISELESAIDEVWVGQSADNFKKNLENDVSKIQMALQSAYYALTSQFNQIITGMAEVDNNLVERRQP